MKNLLYLIFTFLIVSCGKVSPNGNIESKEINLEEFSGLDLKGKFRVFYVNSPKNFVAVETYPNVFKNLDLDVKDKTLFIKESRETQGVDFYNITIYSKYNPEKISMSDSVEMNISSAIKTDHFRLNLKNNSKFIGWVNSRKAEVEMSDKTRANFQGFTKNASMKISDTASIIAPYWMVDTFNIDSKNGVYIEVNAKDSLKGVIGNTTKMVYYGDPVRALKTDKTAKVENKILN